MPESLRHVPADPVITGWDSANGASSVSLSTREAMPSAQVRCHDLWTQPANVSEMNLMQLEGKELQNARPSPASCAE